MRILLAAILLVAALAAGTWIGMQREPAPNVTGPVMRLHFIDVGAGDSILIESPDGRDMLVDAGGEDSAKDLVSYLRARQVRALDLLVITHPLPDHMGGVPEVLRSFHVGQILDSGYSWLFGSNSRLQNEVLRDAAERKIPYLAVSAGQEYRLGRDVRIDVLSPPAVLFKRTGDDARNNSVVLKVTFGSVSALLTGDIEHEAEAALIASRRNLESSILKVADHGSDKSTSLELLRQVKPAFTIISAGGRVLPGRAALERLDPRKLDSQAFRTDESGTIVLTTDGSTVVAQVER
jgi:competence protein ComEC